MVLEPHYALRGWHSASVGLPTEIVLAAAAAYQKIPRFYMRFLYALPIDISIGVSICVFYRRFYMRFL